MKKQARSKTSNMETIVKAHASAAAEIYNGMGLHVLPAELGQSFADLLSHHVNIMAEKLQGGIDAEE